MRHQESLKSTLAETFDLKHQLEQLRVREAQSRVSRLEQQIGQRQSQRTQIIERRARELIEGDQTQWNRNPDADANSAPPQESDSLAKAKNPHESSNPLRSLTGLPDPLSVESEKAGTNLGETNLDAQASVSTLPAAYKDLAIQMETARHEVETVRNKFEYIEELWKKKVISKREFEQVTRDLETARSKLQIHQEELDAVLSDLDTRLKILDVELNGSRRLYEANEKQYKNGNISFSQHLEAELRFKRAELAARICVLATTG